jgi:hypothetical protein
MSNFDERVAAIKTLESLRDRTLFTYFKGLEMSKRDITQERAELASLVWDDIVEGVVMMNGDIGIVLEAGLEVIINNAIEDYIKRG